MRAGSELALARCFEGREVSLNVLEPVGWARPIVPACVPKRAQALFVRNRVLDNDGADALRVRERYAKADRTAVILHEQDIFCDAKVIVSSFITLARLSKVYSKLDGEGALLLPKPGIIGRDKMILVGEEGQQRFPHPR